MKSLVYGLGKNELRSSHGRPPPLNYLFLPQKQQSPTTGGKALCSTARIALQALRA